jgi:hypothetical protein
VFIKKIHKPGVFSSFEEFLPCFPELSGYSGEETDGKEPKDKKNGRGVFLPPFSGRSTEDFSSGGHRTGS